MMETMIPPQVGMRLRTMREKEKRKRKKQRRKEKEKKEKKEKKKKRERRGMLVPHLCFKVAPCFSYGESPMLSLSYTSGNFSYRVRCTPT